MRMGPYDRVHALLLEEYRPFFLRPVMHQAVFDAPVRQGYDEIRPPLPGPCDLRRNGILVHPVHFRPQGFPSQIGTIGEVHKGYPHPFAWDDEGIPFRKLGGIAPCPGERAWHLVERTPEARRPLVEDMVVCDHKHIHAVPADIARIIVRG